MSTREQLEERIQELEQHNRELSLLLESELYLLRPLPAPSLPESMIHSLVLALDSRDPSTAGHSSRVALYSLWIARELGWEEEACRHFYLAALMHDIGKIGVPDSILLKEEPLSPAEFEVMSSHTTTGARILSRLEPAERRLQASQVARYHHEKLDGSGYPEGLRGEEIPLDARIVAVADAFDAMTTDRPYAKGRSYREGLAELARCSGVHFDPEVVSAFERVMRERAEQEEQEEQKEALGSEREAAVAGPLRT